jgi:hypothetical protein
MLAREAEDLSKIKTFCAKILKTLAPPLLREIEASSNLSVMERGPGDVQKVV